MAVSQALAIVGGRVIDPASGLDRETNLIVENGRVTRLDAPDSATASQVIDARGCLVVPGLIDMHVHLREPGHEHKETIRSGTAAAVAGGFTAVACMPNTKPPLDTAPRIADVVQRATMSGLCHVYPVACLSIGRKGHVLTDFRALSQAGAVAFSDDGDGLADTALMTEAFRRLAEFDGLAIQHCEDPAFPRGVLHLGLVSSELGLAGLDPLAEEAMIARDLLLAEATGARYHVAHISTARAIELVRRARAAGVRVSAEVCPHHLLLTDEACRSLNPDAKMHPPLRSASDRAACVDGVREKVIDVLATDHAPHARDEKSAGFVIAPPGVVGLETALALNIEALITPGHLSWMDLIERMSTAPARLLGVEGGTLAPGSRADITLIDPAVEWTIDPAGFHSRSQNTPFGGRQVKGRTRSTIVGGRVRFDHGEVLHS